MKTKTFDQFELWGSLEKQNRHLRRNNYLHWIVHIILVAAIFLVFTRPPLAIRIDKLGRAELVDTASGIASQPTPEEAEHVARLFACHLLEVTSGSVRRDIEKALALMTVNFERAYREKLRDDPMPAAIDRANVRTELSFDDGATEVKAQKDERGRVTRYFVTLQARMDLFRADVLTRPFFTRNVLIRTTLITVPRTKRTLNGLLVDFFEKTVLEPANPAQVSANPIPMSGGTQ
jgi:hypothetical protein